MSHKQVLLALLCAVTLSATADDQALSGDQWKITESPLGMVLADNTRSRAKLTSMSLIHDNRVFSFRYVQYAFDHADYGPLLTCRRVPVAKCDPATYETAFLLGRDVAYGMHHWYWNFGLSLVTDKSNSRRNSAPGLPVELGYYRVFGRFFAIGPIWFADMNREQGFAGVVMALNYGLLH